MKQTTKEWLLAAEDDLFSAKKLVTEERLTNIVAFHCQQCIEKLVKSVIEEKNLPSLKSHDLLRLFARAEISLDEKDMLVLAVINEVYIDARYPGDMGLLPQGKPTIEEAQSFIDFAEKTSTQIKQILAKKE